MSKGKVVQKKAETELTAARARIAKLEEVLIDIAKQKNTEEMSHADGMNGDFEGAYDSFIERARMALACEGS